MRRATTQYEKTRGPYAETNAPFSKAFFPLVTAVAIYVATMTCPLRRLLLIDGWLLSQWSEKSHDVASRTVRETKETQSFVSPYNGWRCLCHRPLSIAETWIQ
jgi:hypothetical protein